jgi:hypothetical protein
MFLLTPDEKRAKTTGPWDFTDSGSLWMEVVAETESSVVIGGIFITVVTVVDIKETPYLYTLKKHT